MDARSSLPIFVLILIVLVALSAYFSASETAFASYNKMRMKSEAEDKKGKKARHVLELSENYEKLISTILIGNNIVNILATSIATLLFVELLGEALGATVSTVVMTLAILTFGEITPKTVAKRVADKFSKKVVGSLNFLTWILTPLTFIFNLWQKFVLSFLKDDGEASVTEDEIITVVEEAAEDGEIDEQESELIKNVIKFSDLDVNDILTPRVDVAAVDINWDRERIAKVFADTEFSRLPVYEENIDNILGILYQKDFFNHSDQPVKELIKDKNLLFVDDSIVRGTQLKDNVVKLLDSGVKEVHMRIACPPLIFPCKFLNFSTSRSTYDLYTRRVIRDMEGTDNLTDEVCMQYADPNNPKHKEMVDVMRRHLQLTSLKFQRLEDLVAAIGLPKCELCTHCWDNSSYTE